MKAEGPVLVTLSSAVEKKAHFAEAGVAPTSTLHLQAHHQALPPMNAVVLPVAEVGGGAEADPKPCLVLFLPQVQLGNQPCSKEAADNAPGRLLVNDYRLAPLC